MFMLLLQLWAPKCGVAQGDTQHRLLGGNFSGLGELAVEVQGSESRRPRALLPDFVERHQLNLDEFTLVLATGDTPLQRLKFLLRKLFVESKNLKRIDISECQDQDTG